MCFPVNISFYFTLCSWTISVASGIWWLFTRSESHIHSWAMVTVNSTQSAFIQRRGRGCFERGNWVEGCWAAKTICLLIRLFNLFVATLLYKSLLNLAIYLFFPMHRAHLYLCCTETWTLLQLLTECYSFLESSWSDSWIWLLENSLAKTSKKITGCK